MRTTLHLAAICAWVTLIALVLLHLFVKDRFPGLSLLFYGTPKPCLAMLAAALCVWPCIALRWRLAAAAVVVVLGAWWLSCSWCTGRPAATTSADLKLLFWNLARPKGIDTEMVDLMRELQPDLAAFVEPGSNAGALLEEYRRLLPGYEAIYLPRGILFFSRLPSRSRERGKLEEIGAFGTFEVTDVNGTPFPIVVADVFPHPFHTREPQLREALSHARGRTDAILVGDFNTPSESLFFEPFRGTFTDAFDDAGRGLRETWPFGLPLLSLDHIWIGKDWTISRAEKHYRLTGSDHAALFVSVRRK